MFTTIAWIQALFLKTPSIAASVLSRNISSYLFKDTELKSALSPHGSKCSDKPAKKLMIFGIPGSGKSTFATQLGSELTLPVYHLDRYFFLAGWKVRPFEEFLVIQQNFVNLEEWIIDGNSTGSLEMSYRQSDIVLYFRFNRILCLYRIFKRLFFKDPRILDRAEGCREHVPWCFIQYLWGFDHLVKDSIVELREKYSDVQYIELRSRRDVKAILATLKGNSHSPLSDSGR